MKFIQNYELREWVKDSLRKAIFQKAHALAVQTGCEVLFKVHDSQDITGCQYYATTNLKRIYRNSKLQQPEETQVSGETGLPLMDKCIQYGEDASALTESSIPSEDGGGGDGDMQSAFQGQDMGANQSAVPMQLSSASGFSDFNSQTQQTRGDEGNADSDIITDITSRQNLLSAAPQVKQEPGTGMFQQQNSMFGQQQRGMMGSQGMMGVDDQSMVQQQSGYQVPVAPKPYQCSICRKAFKSVHVLQKHIVTFHTPSGSGGSGMRKGRGRGGSRGWRGRGSRGRGRKLTISRTQIGGQEQQYQAMPSVKTEADANGGSDQDGTTIGQQQQQDQFVDGAAAAGSTDQSGFPQDFPSASTDDPSTSQADTSWQQQFVPPLPDGSSPSGLNLPSANSFFGQQNPPTSMYSTPSQSPRASTSGGGSSGGSRRRKGPLQRPKGKKRKGPIQRRKGPRIPGRLGQQATLSRENVMKAILQVAGPVSTRYAIRQHWRFLRNVPTEEFIQAASELESRNLGRLVRTENDKAIASRVFVKRPPDEVMDILRANPNVCDPAVYVERYEKPSPKSITFAVRAGLVKAKLVSKKQFL